MYSGGSGTKQDPYLIATKADIELMFQNAEDENYYKQIADIDMLGAEYSWQGDYKGAYDGQNYKISNVNFSAGTGAGFFGRVYKMADFDGDAQIKNVRLVAISVTGDHYCGCFAGSPASSRAGYRRKHRDAPHPPEWQRRRCRVPASPAGSDWGR